MFRIGKSFLPFFDDFNDNGGGDPDPFARLGDSFPGGDDHPGDDPNERPEPERREPPATNEGEGDPNREPAPASAGRSRLSDEQIERVLADNERISREIETLRASSGETERLRSLLAAAVGLKPGEAAAPVDPKTQIIRDRMFAHFPELKVLSEYATDLPGLLKELKELAPHLPALREKFPLLSQSVDDGRVRNAEMFSDKLQNSYAAALLGEGKAGKDLSDAQVKRLGRHFIAYCSEDPERIQRYQRGDSKLVEEFLDEERDTIQTARRQRLAAAVNRNDVRVPSGGGSGTPLGGAEKPKPTDPDAIFESAWEKTQDARATA